MFRISSVAPWVRFAAAVCGLAASVGAATLTWDANPTTPGPDDGSGNWAAAPANTNWWNGATDVAWNNANLDTAVIGVATTTSPTITLTNPIVAGGLVFSNSGPGNASYTLATSGGATLSLSKAAGAGSILLARGDGGTGNDVITPPVLATNGLAISSSGAYTNEFVQFKSATNFITGSLALGTPGNAAYGAPTAVYVDFNTPIDSSAVGINYVLTGCTNITVYSNATFRMSAQNGSQWNPPWPKNITISGDGRNGNSGAWIITGNSGGIFNGNVILAGGSTIDCNTGTAGQTYTLNNPISGTGRLQLVCGNASKHTLVLTNACTYAGDTVVAGGLSLVLLNGDNRLPAGTVLTLGATGTPVAEWNKLGKLTLGNSTRPANQTLAGLQTGGVTGCSLVGGNSSASSILVVNAAADFAYAGTLGGSSAPASRLGLVKNGSGRLSLQGPSQCDGGYTITAGSLEFGDGISDNPLSGPITNNATLLFNVASNLLYSDTIAGVGSFTKRGGGTLIWNGTNACTGAFVVSNGTLGGNGFIAGPVVITPTAILAPGASIGLLTISNTLTLAGTTVMQLDKLTPTNDSVRGLMSVSYGGTLVLSNVAGNYAVGDAFKLFDAASYTGSFTNFIPAQPGPGRAWDASTLASDGTLRITTNSTPDNPPVWTVNPVLKPDAATTVAYNATLADSATDPDVGDTLSFSKISGPAWLAVAADGTLSGTPGAADLGTNSFTVRVTDSASVSADATLLINVIANPNAPVQLASPDGRLVLGFAVSNFDSSVSCPVYTVACTGQTVIATSKLGLTFGTGAWRENVTVTARTTATNDTTWTPVGSERSLIRDNYNEMVITMQETVAPNRIVQVTFRAYNEGVAFYYNIPAQAGLADPSALSEQTEFRFTANHAAWSVTTAQGTYSSTTISGLANGNERPLTVQMSPNLYLALGEARLVDYARMKFNQLGKANSLVASLSSSVAGALPLRSPWRFVMVADSPGHLLENNSFVLNLNDPCALTNTAWIKPGKVIREISLTTTGAVAFVDFAVQHQLQYIEFDAGWYGPENTTATATNVNVDPARSPGPLDLQYVINYGKTNGVGVILYVNWLAMTNELSLLPPLYQGWGVKGIKYGFVGFGNNPGPQPCVDTIAAAARICATNQILMDVHDEYRMTGWSRTYPNFLTAEGISGDEATPTAAQDTTLLFTRMLAGPADHTMCFYDARVTNNWTHAYQLAKAVCFFSPWQFLYWYDGPTNAPRYGSFTNTGGVIVGDPALEFYDYMPTVWDDTKVVQGSIGQYAVIARRSGDDWFLGAMNAGTTRTLTVPLTFLTPGRKYIAHRFYHDPALATRTQVHITRTEVTATNVLSLPLTASNGEAWRITPTEPPAFQAIWPQGDGSMSLTATGKVTQPWSWWAGSDVTVPVSNWSLLGTGLFSNSPVQLLDNSATNYPRRFYRLSSP
jgi:alpha-glucosidase